MADLNKNKRYQRNQKHPEKGNKIHPSVGKNLLQIHPCKQHACHNHACGSNHTADRTDCVIDKLRQMNPCKEKHHTYYYGNHIDIKDNLSPVIGAFTAYNLFAVSPQKYQLHTHESTAVKHPLLPQYKCHNRNNQIA